jgi:hypothetical protein
MSFKIQSEYKRETMMTLSRPRLQVVQSDEIAKAIATIRKYRPGLINDSMVVTSALVEHALALGSEKTPQPSNYGTPYGMTIVRAGDTSLDVGILQFLSKNFRRIAAIIAHIDNEKDEFMDYISRGQEPVYTFVMKGKGFTDFEFIHVASGDSLFEACLTLLVLDLKHHCDDIRFNVIRSKFHEDSGEQQFAVDYVPSLDEMAKLFFKDEFYLFDRGGNTSMTLDLGWEADLPEYHGLNVKDTRYVDYSHALIGLKESSIQETKSKYGVEDLVRSGVLSVSRDVLHRRFRCMCDGWEEERQTLDLYEIGRIFLKHFKVGAIFSAARILNILTSMGNSDRPISIVYIESDKRIEILPVDWGKISWFTYYVEGKSSNSGWSCLDDDPNPFRLYDMADFYPEHLEIYKQKKKKPKQ